jgi:hypothetical protein
MSTATFFLTAKLEQAGGKDVTDALVVIGIELEQAAIVGHSLIASAALPQASGDTGAGGHIGAGFQDEPEVTRVCFESAFAQSPLAGVDALAVKIQCLVQRCSLFGQQHVGIGTVRRNADCLSSECQSPVAAGGFPSLVNDLLRLPEEIRISPRSVLVAAHRSHLHNPV